MFFHNLNRISDFWCTYQIPWPNLNPGSTILPDPLEPNLNPRSTILPDPPAPNSNPDFGTLLDHSQPKIDGKSSFLPFIFSFRLFLTNCVPLCCQLMRISIILGRSIRRRILTQGAYNIKPGKVSLVVWLHGASTSSGYNFET